MNEARDKILSVKNEHKVGSGRERSQAVGWETCNVEESGQLALKRCLGCISPCFIGLPLMCL